MVPRNSQISVEAATTFHTGTAEHHNSAPSGDRSHSNGKVESEKHPRDHFYYKDAKVAADGKYHCPWQREGKCTHKPDKLKCNYE
jgi:hypothetical protein